MFKLLYAKFKGFEAFLGSRLYGVLVLSFVAGFLESLGFISFLPLLEFQKESGIAESGPAGFAGNWLALLGFQNEFLGLLFLIGALFLLKGGFTFFALKINSRLRAALQFTMRTELTLKVSLLKYRDFLRGSPSFYSNLINEHVNRSVQSFYFLMHLRFARLRLARIFQRIPRSRQKLKF